MNSEIFPFQIGKLDCYAISDGTLGYENPAEAFFTNASKEALKKALKKHGIDMAQ